MVKGTVKRWLRSYGFIDSQDHDEDVFVHTSDLQATRTLKEGQQVEFEIRSTYKGPRAINVKVLSEEA